MIISEAEVEARKREFWGFVRDSEDTSKSGRVISPDGWQNAVRWLLMYADHLEDILVQKQAHINDLTDRLR